MSNLPPRNHVGGVPIKVAQTIVDPDVAELHSSPHNLGNTVPLIVLTLNLVFRSLSLSQSGTEPQSVPLRNACTNK